ncbi:DUF2987 domain-containing protein [Oxalobacteraceae bacterium]|nr:DUF2987 domain-containing protein [Oxalobacteraceae bacterium]
MKRSLICCAAVCLSVAAVLAPAQARAAAAAAELRNWAPYQELAELPGKFNAIPPAQRENLVFRMKVEPVDADVKLDQVQLYIVRRDERIAIPIDADGTLHLPDSAQLHKDNPPIYISLPKGKRLALLVDVAIRLPEGNAFSYADLMKSMKQASDGVRSRAGIWGFMMPKAGGLSFKFPDAKPAQIELKRKSGEVSYLQANRKGRVILPVDAKLERDNPVVAFAVRPLEVVPSYDVEMRLFVDSEG